LVGATRPLPVDGGVEKLHGDPTNWPPPKDWTKDGVAKRLWCATVEKEMRKILRRVRRRCSTWCFWVLWQQQGQAGKEVLLRIGKSVGHLVKAATKHTKVGQKYFKGEQK